ncbi:M20/M25/M40 family metallo-hydrolase [Kitasatospora sp. NPDC096147]|uniref:M20/M25/M40 family metallo-hydrolase n=1 Tax=Kitasatospora sp. NPDC096147 TaxID=3364093 RepID=UPI00380C1D07
MTAAPHVVPEAVTGAPDRPSPPPPPTGGAPRRAGLLALLLVALLTALTLVTLQPPDARPASAPTRDFSAGRALTDAREVGREAHPIGSPAAAAARTYLTGRLTELGGTTEVLTSTVARNGKGTAGVAEVASLHARFPGTDPTGHVVLVAHYDSVPAGPGASDDGVNVAAILEVVRALRADGAPRNDIDVVFTDGEEAGLLGASAFVDAKALDPARSVVLNLEARGSTGPSIMFESGERNRGVLGALGAADRPIATSLADEIYRFLPNDTDFSEFKEGGFTGLNFAFVDGSARYHTTADSVANLDADTLQHQGEGVLAAARELAGRDLGALPDGRDTYFTALGFLVHYPQALVPVVAALAVLALLLTLGYARRHGVPLRGTLGAAAAFPLTLAAAVLVGAGGWALLCAVRPEYGGFMTGDTYRPSWFRAAFTLLLAAAVLGWYLLLRRRVSTAQLALGVWVWAALLTVVTTLLAPGASYLFAWPLLFGCAGLAAAVRWGRAEPGWLALGATAAALPAVTLLIPIVVLVLPTLGLAQAAVPLILLTVLLALALPLLGSLPRRTGGWTSLVALAAGLALLGVGLRVDVTDAEHPAHTSLAYFWDAEHGARWVSADSAPPAWTSAVAGTRRADLRGEFPTSPTGGSDTLVAPAPDVKPPVPAVTVTPLGTATSGGERTVRLHIAPGAGTSHLGVYADLTTHQVLGATVLGAEVHGGTNRPDAEGPWKWGFVAWTVPADGLTVDLRLTGGPGLPLRVTAYHPGLPPAAGLDTLPTGLTWSTWGSVPSDVTVVAATVRI